MNSLGTRLFVAFLAVILLVVIVVGLGLLVLLRDEPLVQRQGLAQLQAISAAVLPQARGAGEISAERAAGLASDLAAEYGVRILLATAAGEVLVDSGATEPPLNLLRFRAARRDPAYPGAFAGTVRDRRLRAWLYVARPIGGQRMLVVAAPAERLAVLSFFRDNLLAPLLQAAGVALLVAGLLSVVITRSVAGPLGKMSSVAQSIAQGRYDQATPVSGPEEVRALGQAINRMAAQVQANQQAQQGFLANVSHELRTPLTSIQGFAQAMLDGAVNTPEGVQRSANIIYAEAERLRRMVEELLDLARLRPSLRPTQLSRLDLRALVAAQAEQFGLRAQQAGVALRVEVPASLPAVMGDADRLAQVFGNLLDNAFKHTPAGGTVNLSAREAASGVEVAIADTGPGIPAQDLPRIFERFYQVDKARVRAAGGGVGLGLAISQEIVAAHGGTLRVESEPGKGAVFVVALPRA